MIIVRSRFSRSKKANFGIDLKSLPLQQKMAIAGTLGGLALLLLEWEP